MKTTEDENKSLKRTLNVLRQGDETAIFIGQQQFIHRYTQFIHRRGDLEISYL